MKSIIIIALYYFVPIVLCLSSLTCGRGDNAKPVIEKLILPTTVQPGETAVFKVVALDPDGDQLTYIWMINGEISSTKLSTMIWEVPQILAGRKIDVVISVSDSRNEPVVTKSPLKIQAFDTRHPKNMVLIPVGEFEMGTGADQIPQLLRSAKQYFPDAEASWFENETPRHKVCLDAFYMDIYEVSNAQYKKFIDKTGYHPPLYWNTFNFAPNHPVVGVSWHDAMAYAKWAGKRLPTEAEWEYAARGGLVGKKYPWGDAEADGKRANFADKTINLNWSNKNVSDGYKYTASIGAFPPNDYGLYDMAGNVFEWCFDWHDAGYYAKSPEYNPTGPISGTMRVIRGSSWSYPPTRMRVSRRIEKHPTSMLDYVGFRCIKNVVP